MLKIDIRWSDIDANRHLANSAYMNFMSHARLEYMKKAGIGQKELEEHHLAPIVFYENIFYFREVLPEETLYVSVELKGLSEGGMFFQFIHNIYNEEGQNKASCEMMGAWMSMKTRKLTTLPKIILENFLRFNKSDDFRTLTKKDTRKFDVEPKDIDKDQIKTTI